ncbi:hypothetical protein ACFLU6_16365, partial [Acidobacteriota bacterium]
PPGMGFEETLAALKKIRPFIDAERYISLLKELFEQEVEIVRFLFPEIDQVLDRIDWGTLPAAEKWEM